jgi:serine/threonine kinase 32
MLTYCPRITERVESTGGQPIDLNLPPSDGGPQAITSDVAIQASDANGLVQGAFQPGGLHQTSSQQSQQSQEGSPSSVKSRPNSAHTKRHAQGRPPPLPPYPSAYTNNSVNQVSGGKGLGRTGAANGIIVESPTGGMQVTLDGAGSWSDLARQDATLPTDAAGVANANGKPEGSGGVFGFLSRKKGRAHSPKPKERGVLGKEGARAVIG